jgi:hypothetical protein
MTPANDRPIKVVIYVENEEPFTADMDGLPAANASYVLVRNPQTREGRSVAWISRGTKSLLFPMARIMFIEIVRDENNEGYEFPWKPTAPLPGQ